MPKLSQIYEKQSLSTENGFIEKQFSVKISFDREVSSGLRCWMPENHLPGIKISI